MEGTVLGELPIAALLWNGSVSGELKRRGVVTSLVTVALPLAATLHHSSPLQIYPLSSGICDLSAVQLVCHFPFELLQLCVARHRCLNVGLLCVRRNYRHSVIHTQCGDLGGVNIYLAQSGWEYCRPIKVCLCGSCHCCSVKSLLTSLGLVYMSTHRGDKMVSCTHAEHK